eukprot:TRINITY_DN259_c0_g2_i4.p1 TRINITY_DN259_c0_g2~~TRINITY_DN259_c0_g2_i4.p1  ORF type:complete len:927 (-),score=92.44 TRINITY_DN259_c0_g2_i4:53-2455(-)
MIPSCALCLASDRATRLRRSVSLLVEERSYINSKSALKQLETISSQLLEKDSTLAPASTVAAVLQVLLQREKGQEKKEEKAEEGGDSLTEGEEEFFKKRYAEVEEFQRKQRLWFQGLKVKDTPQNPPKDPQTPSSSAATESSISAGHRLAQRGRAHSPEGPSRLGPSRPLAQASFSSPQSSTASSRDFSVPPVMSMANKIATAVLVKADTADALANLSTFSPAENSKYRSRATYQGQIRVIPGTKPTTTLPILDNQLALNVGGTGKLQTASQGTAPEHHQKLIMALVGVEKMEEVASKQKRAYESLAASLFSPRCTVPQKYRQMWTQVTSGNSDKLLVTFVTTNGRNDSFLQSMPANFACDCNQGGCDACCAGYLPVIITPAPIPSLNDFFVVIVTEQPPECGVGWTRRFIQDLCQSYKIKFPAVIDDRVTFLGTPISPQFGIPPTLQPWLAVAILKSSMELLQDRVGILAPCSQQLVRQVTRNKVVLGLCQKAVLLNIPLLDRHKCRYLPELHFAEDIALSATVAMRNILPVNVLMLRTEKGRSDIEGGIKFSQAQSLEIIPVSASAVSSTTTPHFGNAPPRDTSPLQFSGAAVQGAAGFGGNAPRPANYRNSIGEIKKTEPDLLRHSLRVRIEGGTHKNVVCSFVKFNGSNTVFRTETGVDFSVGNQHPVSIWTQSESSPSLSQPTFAPQAPSQTLSQPTFAPQAPSQTLSQPSFLHPSLSQPARSTVCGDLASLKKDKDLKDRLCNSHHVVFTSGKYSGEIGYFASFNGHNTKFRLPVINGDTVYVSNSNTVEIHDR